ncbi:MAG: hypothetical protein ACI807_001175 [Paracoccaceae bacterium]|jgi:hypothetical protein
MDASILNGLAPLVLFFESTVKAVPQLLFRDATLTDAKGLAGGVLRMKGLLAEDVVSVLDGGPVAGLNGLSGANVTYCGEFIGTLSGGGGTELRIALSAGADAAAVEVPIESITHPDTNGAPTADRTLRPHPSDAAGSGSASTPS